MNKTENFEPGDPKVEMAEKPVDKASDTTGKLLRDMGWPEFDDLLNSIEGLDKSKSIHILSTGSWQ